MSEKTESNSGSPSSSIPDTIVSRRKVLIGGGATIFAAGLDAVLLKQAQADTLVPTTPPDFISGNPVESHKPSAIPNLEAGSRAFSPDKKEQVIVTVIDRKVKTAENFLSPSPEGSIPNVSVNLSRVSKDSSVTIKPQPENPKKPDIKTPVLNVDMPASPDNADKTARELALEAGAQLSLLIIESNRSKDLLTNFALGFGKYTRVNLYAFQNGRSTEGQMAYLSDAGYFLDFPNYTGAPPNNNIFTQRENLTETLLINCLSIWMSESDQLSQKLNQAPYHTQAPMTDLFLFGLKLLSECGNNPDAFKSLGIKEKTMNNILKLSEDPELVKYFKQKYK